MIRVHHLEQSRSQRVLWLLEELGLPYELVPYKRDPETLRAPKELRKVHPLGKSPVIEDGGRVVAESGAILEYLLARYDREGAFLPLPGDEDEQLRYRYWMHYAEGSAMPPLLLTLVFRRLRQAKVPFFARPIARAIADKALAGFVMPQVRTHLDYIESELGKSTWFAGPRFSAADIQMSFPVEAAATRGDGVERPHTAAFLERIRARPAYQRAIERGGGFKPLG